MGLLENNTDRSFFMIGAVIFSGLIIAFVIYLFAGGGSLWTEIQELVGGMFGGATESITNIQDPNGVAGFIGGGW